MFLALQASENLPPPNNGGTRNPELPLDDNIWILLAAGLLFGLYIVYKRSRATNKAS